MLPDSLDTLPLTRVGAAVATTFWVSVAFTWLTRRIATARGWVEQPRSDRWHRRPTARLGGTAILGSLLVGGVAFFPFSSHIAALLLLASAMFAVGLTDDLVRLRPQTKLVTQVAAGVLLYVAGFRFNVAMPWAIDFFVVVFWVVAITNAMNLLDNMDGLAAGVAVIAASYRFLFYFTDGNFEGALVSAVFVAAVAGFLVFNFSPASIFMGDCGSFVIGFVLAALNLTTSQMYAKSLVAILLFPALVLAIPIFDTTLVSLARWVSGRRVSQGGADHSSHRLVAVGLSERRAVLVLHLLATASGGAAYLVYRVGFSYAWFGGAMFALGLILFGIYLSSIKIYPEDHLPAHASSTPGFLLHTQFAYKRVMLWVLVDVIALALAYYAAFLFRFGDTPRWQAQFSTFLRTVPFAVGLQLVCVSLSGVYRSDWQTFSLHEAKRIVAGATGGVVCLAIVLLGGFGLGPGTLLTLVVDWGAAVLALTGARGVVRALSDALRPSGRDGEPTLIYGAGAGGELALRELQANTRLGLRVVAFLDDNALRHRSVLHGVEVAGGVDALESVVRSRGVRCIVLSTAKIRPDVLARIQAFADQRHVSLYRMSIEFQPVAIDESSTAPAPAPAPVAEGDMVKSRSG